MIWSTKKIEPIHFRKGFYDRSAQTDCYKEMLVRILKGLKHLNNVIYTKKKLHVSFDTRR